MWGAAVLRLAAMVCSALMLAYFFVATATADHEKYQYKFPCNPADACYVTQLAHVGNAFDFDPQGSAGLGDIRAVSEGTFVDYFTDSMACTYPSGSGLGMYAEIDDVFGRTMRYGHLSAFGGLEEDKRVLQGDKVGVEGNTGYSYLCQPHLHLEGISTTSYVDGVATSSITAGPTLYTSTNSYVGHEIPNPNPSDLPAKAIRDVYIYLGSLLDPDNSWEAVGWTADWTDEEAGCPPNSFCRLYVHYAPDPVVGHWGSVQVFRKHVGVPVLDDAAIMAGRWAVNDAYLVQNPFFEAWLGGLQGVGLPLMNQTGGGTSLCGTGCEAYQRFSHGYIWKPLGQTVQAPVFCPDVAATGSSTNDAGPYWPDHVVDLANDIFWTIQAFDPGGAYTPADPTAAWSRGRYDVNGDGVIDLANDIYGVIPHFAENCFP